MVSRKFGDLLVEVELEKSEMWRKGTIRIRLEKGDLHGEVFVSPPLVKEFRYTAKPIVDLVKFEDWMMAALKEGGALLSLNDDSLDDLVWDLIEQKTTFTFWISGLTLMDVKKICDENDLDFERVRETFEVEFTKDGHPCGIDYHDPFYNPGNKLNGRH